MIISKTPHRVSLLGGSTDLLDFIEKYKCGSVINFSINKYLIFIENLILNFRFIKDILDRGNFL